MCRATINVAMLLTPLVLGACVTANPQVAAPQPPATVTPAQPTTPAPGQPRVATLADVNGVWQPIDGAGKELAYQALFRNGQFASYDRARTDPNELLAKGTYTANSPTNINLDFVGAASGRNSASCRLTSPDRMNCTLANGTPLLFKKVNATG